MSRQRSVVIAVAAEFFREKRLSVLGDYEFAGSDRELASAVGRRLAAQTKDGKAPIRAVDVAKVDRFKSGTPDWKAMSASEIQLISCTGMNRSERPSFLMP